MCLGEKQRKEGGGTCAHGSPGACSAGLKSSYLRVKGMGVKGVEYHSQICISQSSLRCGELWEEGRHEGRVGSPGGRN